MFWATDANIDLGVGFGGGGRLLASRGGADVVVVVVVVLLCCHLREVNCRSRGVWEPRRRHLEQVHDAADVAVVVAARRWAKAIMMVVVIVVVVGAMCLWRTA